MHLASTYITVHKTIIVEPVSYMQTMAQTASLSGQNVSDIATTIVAIGLRFFQFSQKLFRVLNSS